MSSFCIYCDDSVLSQMHRLLTISTYINTVGIEPSRLKTKRIDTKKQSKAQTFPRPLEDVYLDPIKNDLETPNEEVYKATSFCL